MREAVRIFILYWAWWWKYCSGIVPLLKITTEDLTNLVSMGVTALTALSVVLVGADGAHSTVRQLLSRAAASTDPARASSLMSRKSRAP
jgi:hypothetical protein